MAFGGFGKRRRAAALQDAGALTTTCKFAERLGVRQPSGALTPARFVPEDYKKALPIAHLIRFENYFSRPARVFRVAFNFSS